MAIVIVYEGTTFQLSGTSLDSANWSPTAGHLIFATSWTFFSTAPVPSDTFTDTGGGTWQTIYTYNEPGVNAWLCAYYRQLGSTPGTGHVTISCPGNDEAVLGAFDVGGHDTSTPIRQFINATTGAGATSITLTLGSAPRSDSCCLTCAYDINSGNTLTPTGGFSSATGLAGYDGDSQFSAYQNGGSPPTAVQWTGLDNRNVDIGGYFEIQTPAGAPTEAYYVQSQAIPQSLLLPRFTILPNVRDPRLDPTNRPNFYTQSQAIPQPLPQRASVVTGFLPPVASTAGFFVPIIQSQNIPRRPQFASQLVYRALSPVTPAVTGHLPIWQWPSQNSGETMTPVNMIDFR